MARSLIGADGCNTLRPGQRLRKTRGGPQWNHRTRGACFFGINISIFGVILALAGGGTIAIGVGVIGLAVSAISMTQAGQPPVRDGTVPPHGGGTAQ